MPIVIVALVILLGLFCVYCFVMIKGTCEWWAARKAKKAAAQTAVRSAMQKKVNLGF